MYESIVLICCRALVTPVPGAAGVRAKSIAPKSLVNTSSSSRRSNGSGWDSPPAVARRPKVWSMNCPHAKPHWLMPFSENRFWAPSLKIRLLTYRSGAAGATGRALPSA